MKEEPALVTSPVAVPIVREVVKVAALPVTEPAIALVTSKSVNQPFVTLVAVAPIVVTKRLAHFFNVVPKSSVLSVSETSVVLMATEARLSRAVVAPEPPLPLAAAVTRPLALTVMLAFVKEPTLEFTVARVSAVSPVASPVCVALVTLALFVAVSLSIVSKLTA